MNTHHTLVRIDDSIIEVVQKITDAPHRGGMSGIAVIVDDNNTVLGVVTDGDIRKAVCRKVDLNKPIEFIMTKDPVCVSENFNTDELIREAYKKMQEKWTRTQTVVNNKVIKVGANKKFVDIVDLHILYRQADVLQKVIAVYGLGFVGLTLAPTLAENELFEVMGVDPFQEVISNLQDGIAPFYEKGLPSLLRQVLAQGNMRFFHDNSNFKADVHVISVGTPVDEKNRPVIKHLEEVALQIGQVLKLGDLVICRSTVTVGTTRNLLIPILVKQSGLVAGRDFQVAFAPERTVAGNALKELRTLPQVIGGLTPRCAKLSAAIFERITKTIVSVESLESAEVVKLVNNTYRDLVFSFANEVAYLCDQYNLNAFDVIESANEGYPRNPIPRPSPGVGGICLSKDPYLYTYHEKKDGFSDISLGKHSREINSRGVEYVLWQFGKFLKKENIKSEQMQVLVAGLAFKGIPETSGCRNSPGVELLEALKQIGCVVSVFDVVLKAEEIKLYGAQTLSIGSGLAGCQAVFFMNNHPENFKFELYSDLNAMKHPSFVFDGFGQFNKNEVESVSGVTYASMGYISS